MAGESIVLDTEPDLDGAGEGAGEGASQGTSPGTSPQLDLAGFAGPLAQLLALARAQDIDLRKISLAALVDQLATAFAAAGRGVPLAHKGDWLVMAAWLVLLRSRLLLPPDAPAQQEAAAEAGRLRETLLALRAAQGLAGWLEARPQLGQEVFARGAPEWLGTAVEPAHQVDVVGFLWASMALFDDGARDVDTATVYRPAATDLYDVAAARERILLLLTAAPDGAPLERFLPAPPDRAETGSRAALRRRSAWASTLMGGLELAKQGAVVLAQGEDFQNIHVNAAGDQALSSAA